MPHMANLPWLTSYFFSTSCMFWIIVILSFQFYKNNTILTKPKTTLSPKSWKW